MGLAVHQESTSAALCLAVAGEIDVESAARFRRAVESSIDAAVAAGLARVVFDLGGVTFMDSTGLGALIAARVKARTAGVTIGLTSVPDQVRKILSITGLLEIFPVEPDQSRRTTE
jgi:anti-sigma B factor antagonist